jgi:hypothetical protein
MIDKAFNTLVLEIHYLGITEVELPTNEKKVLLYFCREVDTADIPLSITEDQAKQLYRDLEKLFSQII